MNMFTPKFLLALTSFIAFTSNLFAADPQADAATVPEPSVALIGGLCGIIFLFWRRK